MNDRTDLFRNEPRRRPKRLARLLVVAGALVVLAVAGIAGGLWLHVQNKFSDTHQPIEVDPKPGSGEPTNVLVLGSDRRDVVDPADQDRRQFRGGESGQRADTIILVHVSGDGKRAVLLHFPRDLRVNIPDKGVGKINASYNGGANLVVKTIKALTGLPVHHYVEVNFSSFRRIVDAIGGVEMCVNRAYDDPQSGLKIDKPGCYEFDGDTSLSFVRARKVDPDGDFGRIRRQQQFIRTIMDRVTSVGFLFDLPRVVRLANAISTGVVTDEGLSLGVVRQVANRLAGFDQKSVDFRVVPSFPRYIGGVSYVIARETEARALYDAIAADAAELPEFGKTPLSIPTPGDVTLSILNGAGVDGLASDHAARLRAAGFLLRTVGNAERKDEPITRIEFGPGSELKARLLQDHYPDAAVVQVTSRRLPTDLVLVLGRDAVATP